MKAKRKFNKAAIRWIGPLLLAMLCVLSRGSYAAPNVLDSKNLEEINMIRGDLEAIKTYSLGRVSVSNPEVADIANVDSEQILLLAKKSGQTILFLWDEYGKRTIIVRVFEEDLNVVQERMRQLLDSSDLKEVKLEINSLEGKVMVSGKIPLEKKDDFENVVAPFGGSIINLVKVEAIEDLVQVDVQIAELNSSISKTLGIDWTSALQYKEDGNNFETTMARDLLKVGPFTRTTQILAAVNALITEGKGRILSKPKLVVISGKEASFLVGGEVPIRTSNTSAGGNVQENVEFKDYGVSLTITPTIREGKVDVSLSIEVSDIDTSQPVANDVAFLTRTAQTQLYLEDGQTVVLAGLIKQAEGETVRKVPFLGDLPIVGFVFRHRSTPAPNSETELVISLTPTIIKQRDQIKTNKETAKAPDLLDIPGEETGAGGSGSGSTGYSSSEKSLPAKEKTAEELMTINTSVPVEMAPYVQNLQRKISRAIAYPFEAKQKGWEGTVKLLLHIAKDGSLKEVSVKQSSGHDIFDKDALNTAQILAPYDAFPPGLELDDLILTIPIVYSKDLAAKDGVCKAFKPNTADSRLIIPVGLTYSQSVQQLIADSVIYPEEAREKGWEGTVKLGLHILRDGTLAFASVKESSGYDLFDDCALQTAKSLAPYSLFPAESDLQELNLTVPIVYSLKNDNH